MGAFCVLHYPNKLINAPVEVSLQRFYDEPLNLPHHFWPNGRKLFRRQGRWRRSVPAIAFVGGSVLVITLGGGWYQS